MLKKHIKKSPWRKAQAVFDYSSALVGYKPTPTIKKLDTEAMAAPAR
jgi:hypothetical protein